MTMKQERIECSKAGCRWTGVYSETSKIRNDDGISSACVCPKCGCNSFYELDEPIPSERVDHANELIKLIAIYGREFLSHEGTIAHIELGKGGKVFYVDAYTRRRVYTNREHVRWSGFSEGGTMQSLISHLKRYILEGTPIDKRLIANPGFYQDGGNIWGYDQREAEKLREQAFKLPMFDQ
ncbi:hypothetical protein DN730_07910 [Marinomonas piezotolerans]|uniref:Uncharacterized protein n=1 Tax=Marinomonas piezotolerans TaxID=2213058 RepID=A0A370U979_9GAMM|nr:hypothetical protein [Marinomonas piezotolerans]RDL44321.1 hypothetical protein DN730_07910 [Marinomonas piezotolerans]